MNLARKNTGHTWRLWSESAEATEQLAEKLGKALHGAEVIELISDLGGGKTTFVRGLARGAGSSDRVTSPTFTISKIYNASAFDIHHFDFYRLSEPGVAASELAEVMDDPKIVVVIEWADAVKHVLPIGRLTIIIRQTQDGKREFNFYCPPSLAHLQKAVEIS